MTDNETNNNESTEDQTLETDAPEPQDETVPIEASEPQASEAEAAAAAANGGGREWIVPAALLGALVLLVAVFAAGFLVGRGTAPEDESVAAVHVVQDELRSPGLGQERSPFQRFRSPGNERFSPERPFAERGPRGEGRIDQLCALLDDDAIPERAPFYDRLVDACADRA